MMILRKKTIPEYQHFDSKKDCKLSGCAHCEHPQKACACNMRSAHPQLRIYIPEMRMDLCAFADNARILLSKNLAYSVFVSDIKIIYLALADI